MNNFKGETLVLPKAGKKVTDELPKPTLVHQCFIDFIPLSPDGENFGTLTQG